MTTLPVTVDVARSLSLTVDVARSLSLTVDVARSLSFIVDFDDFSTKWWLANGTIDEVDVVTYGESLTYPTAWPTDAHNTGTFTYSIKFTPQYIGSQYFNVIDSSSNNSYDFYMSHDSADDKINLLTPGNVYLGAFVLPMDESAILIVSADYENNLITAYLNGFQVFQNAYTGNPTRWETYLFGGEGVAISPPVADLVVVHSIAANESQALGLYASMSA